MLNFHEVMPQNSRSKMNAWNDEMTNIHCKSNFYEWGLELVANGGHELESERLDGRDDEAFCEMALVFANYTRNNAQLRHPHPRPRPRPHRHHHHQEKQHSARWSLRYTFARCFTSAHKLHTLSAHINFSTVLFNTAHHSWNSIQKAPFRWNCTTTTKNVCF